MNKIKSTIIEPIKKYLDSDLSKSAIISENKNLSGIYRWTNTENGNTYVGSAVNLSKRIASYYQDAELNRNPRPIKDALNKYGHGKFSLEILEYCDKKDLIATEQRYLDELLPEYNILKQAYSLQGFKHSEETIEKLKMKVLTPEQRQFLSDVNTGKLVDDETRQKLSESLKKYRKNNPLTTEALENITRKTTEREGIAVVLTNIETGEKHEFETKTAAGKFLGISRQAIHNGFMRESVIKNKYKISTKNTLDDDNDADSIKSQDNVNSGKDLPFYSFMDDID